MEYWGPACGAIPAVGPSTAGPGNNPIGTAQTKFIEMYSYSQPGGRVKKRLRVIKTMADGASTTASYDFDSTYGYDNEGRMTTVAYPLSGPQYTMTYDAMGRAGTLSDTSGAIASATYGIANQLLTLNGQTFTYNTLFQLTRVQGGVDISYNYSATQNNGKITSQTDNLSGEQVVYTYDSLQRLATAETATNPSVTQWGQGGKNLLDNSRRAGEDEA